MIGKIKYNGLHISGESKLLNVLALLGDNEEAVALIGDYTIDFYHPKMIRLFDRTTDDVKYENLAIFSDPYRFNCNSEQIYNAIIKSLPYLKMVTKNKLAKFLTDIDNE